MNKYPIIWFAVVMGFAVLYSPGAWESGIIFVLAIILAKQIEILNKLNKEETVDHKRDDTVNDIARDVLGKN